MPRLTTRAALLSGLVCLAAAYPLAAWCADERPIASASSQNGKLRVAAEGEKFYFELTANSAVASSGFPNRNGALRIRARRRDGMVPVTT